jgi:deoxyuridine 5'-triphosphate nucleotidohydrolase
MEPTNDAMTRSPDLSRMQHAHVMGILATATESTPSWIDLPVKGRGTRVLSLLRGDSRAGAAIHRSSKKVRVFSDIAKRAQSYLGALPGREAEIKWPEVGQDESWFFLSGLFELAGRVAKPGEDFLWVRLTISSPLLRRQVVEFVPSPVHSIAGEVLEWRGASALDLLGQLYFGQHCDLVRRLVRPKRIRRVEGWTMRVVGLSRDKSQGNQIIVARTDPAAIVPKKERVSDSGYDLTLIYEKKRIGEVVLYGTGVTVEPPQGWYFDVVPRSSIIKLGYIIGNSVGVIDRAYRGEVLVPLIKVDKLAPDLELPARVAQLIPRPIVHFEVSERAALTLSHRGQGGFGSSGR